MSSIYVVEDSAGTRQFIATALGKAGHEVTEILPTCLFSVLEVLHKGLPDLLIVDLLMPNCPGQTLIRAVREDQHLKACRILLLTSHGDERLAQFLQAMGNIHYLAKPVAPQALADCVEGLLSNAQEPDPGWTLACEGVVAVVDDSQLSRTYHATCLRKSGFRPVPIEPTGLLDTVQAIEEARPDLLVLDFLMPGFTGDALIRALRSREALRELPVLVVTAHQGKEIQSLLTNLGEVEVLFKPLHPDTLIEGVRKGLHLD